MFRKLLLPGLIGVITLSLMAGGAIWAAISDFETDTDNTITAGTLELVPTVSGSYTGGPAGLYQVTAGSNGINGNVVFDMMAPDQYGTIKWVLHNTGSVGGTLTVDLNGAYSDGPAAKAPESYYPANNATTGELGTYVMVTLKKGVGSSDSPAMTDLLGSDTTPAALSGMYGALNGNTTAMSASGGASSYVVYLFSWYTTSAKLGVLYNNINIIQGDTAQLDLTFTLSQ
jgi:hypothetical protein